jgi:predicted small lipoprotein YifL
MKKFFYTIIVLFSLALSITSCSKEEIKPAAETNNTGGKASDKGF